MRYERACELSDLLLTVAPCYRVLMIARATDLLRDRALPIPAWTIPADSWVLVLTHRDHEGQIVTGHPSDEPVLAPLRSGGHYAPTYRGRPMRISNVHVATYRCPIHNRAAHEQA